jgi:hypothetical protein
MANVNPTITPNITGDQSVMSIAWTPLTSTNTAGTAVAYPQWRDRTVAITGAFDSCTVVLEGSIDGTNYFTLTDPQGNAISKTAAAMEAVTEMVRFVRPRRTALTVNGADKHGRPARLRSACRG